MKKKIKDLLIEYEIRIKRLREIAIIAGEAKDRVNYELGRLYELKNVISDLERLL